MHNDSRPQCKSQADTIIKGSTLNRSAVYQAYFFDQEGGGNLYKVFKFSPQNIHRVSSKSIMHPRGGEILNSIQKVEILKCFKVFTSKYP